MRFPLVFAGLAALSLLGCGPATRAAPQSVDADALFVAQVHWSPSELTALGILPAFPRNSWVAVVAADGYVRHARIGGPSRHECDDCVGPRMAITLAISEPPTAAYAIGPADRRLPRILLLGETPMAPAELAESWTQTAAFDLDEDGTADLERVERCGGMVPSGCDARVCARRCTATRTVGASEVRGELCASFSPVREACIPPPPPPPPEPVVEEVPEAPPVSAEPETAPRTRRWGSRRRPR